LSILDDLGYKSGRKVNGLVELTKKFISLLVSSQMKSIDLNDAMKLLKV